MSEAARFHRIAEQVRLLGVIWDSTRLSGHFKDRAASYLLRCRDGAYIWLKEMNFTSELSLPHDTRRESFTIRIDKLSGEIIYSVRDSEEEYVHPVRVPHPAGEILEMLERKLDTHDDRFILQQKAMGSLEAALDFIIPDQLITDIRKGRFIASYPVSPEEQQRLQAEDAAYLELYYAWHTRDVRQWLEWQCGKLVPLAFLPEEFDNPAEVCAMLRDTDYFKRKRERVREVLHFELDIAEEGGRLFLVVSPLTDPVLI